MNTSLAVMSSVDDCVTCPSGTYCSLGSAAATPCPPGTYNPNASAGICTSCAVGEFQDHAGQTSCKPCTPGCKLRRFRTLRLPQREGTPS